MISFEPFAAQVFASVEPGAAVAVEVGGEVGPQRERVAVGVAVELGRRPSATAAAMSATTAADGGYGFSLTLSRTATSSCGAP